MAYVSQEDKKKLAPEIKKVLSKYGMKGSISIRHHSTLVVTIQSGAIDFKEFGTWGQGGSDDGYIQVNTYHIENHYSGKAEKFLTELLAAMKGPNYFCDDDAMTDYFHRSHYTDINIGKWNKPYFMQKAAKKVSKKVVKASKNSRALNGWTPEVIDGSVGSITVPTNSTISDASSISETSEQVARMTAKEQDKFVEDIVSRYPNLADTLMTKLGYSLLEHEGE